MDSGRRVVVVTDSTASLPASLQDALDVVVVPLQVVVDGVPHREGVDLTAARLVEALTAGASVTTSQPGPEAFARAYARVAARGAREIVSVHLSGHLSGTATSARLAAQTSGVPVHVVDSGTVGMGLGLAVAAAARAAAGERPGDPAAAGSRGGGARPEVSGAAVVRAAERTAASSSVVFAVDTLEYLRRGGRLGPLASAVGAVLGLRPVLAVRGGRLDVIEKVRTAARVRERVVELGLDAAAHRDRFDMAVHHLGDPEAAQALAQRLRAAAGPGLRDLHVAEISAVVGAHVGPGVLAVVVADA